MADPGRMAVLLVGALVALLPAGCRPLQATSARAPTVVFASAADPAPAFPRAPSPAAPVVAAGTLEPAGEEADTVTLAIHVRTAPTWHIYAHDAGGTANTPTALTLELPPGIEAVEGWRHPPAHPDRESGAPVLAGSFAFRRTLRARPGAVPGAQELVCEMTYQACDPMMCRPPERLTVRVPVVVVAR